MSENVTFIHYSDVLIKKLIKKEQTKSGNKPDGIWFAPDDEWIEWCKNANYAPNLYKYKYRIKSMNPEKIWFIKNADEFMIFFNRYSVEFPGISPQWSYLNWNKISLNYSGIYFDYRNIYAQLLENKKLEDIPLFLMTLDVNSLVIWEPEEVELELLEIKEGDNSFLDSESDSK